MSKAHFEDYDIGEQVETPGRTITETDVVMFAALSGDWNSIHTDEEYAREHTPYGRRIVQGLLVLVTAPSLLWRTSMTDLMAGSSFAGIEKIRFVAPVFIGDTIRLRAEVVEKKKMRDNRGLMSLRFRILNQRDEIVLTARVKVIAACRAAGDEPQAGS